MTFGLLAALARVPDPRDPRGIRYPFASVLAVAVCAVMAGAAMFAAIADWVDDLAAPAWGRLGFTGRVPVLTTVWRLLVRVDAETLTAVLADWLSPQVRGEACVRLPGTGWGGGPSCQRGDAGQGRAPSTRRPSRPGSFDACSTPPSNDPVPGFNPRRRYSRAGSPVGRQ
ncbi:transposase family protein [Micromonospora arida]